MSSDAVKSVKQISFVDCRGDQVEKAHVLVEEVLNFAYGCYIWPSALVMAEFVWYYRDQFANSTVLEIGAGTSLPSLVLAKSSQVARLILSDIPEILPIIHRCLQLNKVDKDTYVNAIEWGKLGNETSIDYVTAKVENDWSTRIDYILGSDTFYDPSQFENLLMLVSYVIHSHNPNCKFFTTYQERSPKRSIQYLLDKWKLKCRQIPKDSFEFDELKYIDMEDDDMEETEREDKSEVKVNAGTLSSVFLLEISAA